MSDENCNGPKLILNLASIMNEHEQNNFEQHLTSYSDDRSTVAFLHPDTAAACPYDSRNSQKYFNRPRSKTASTNISDNDLIEKNHHLSASTPTNLNIFQSVKDLTRQELYRANPLGLLGKEIIYATGTTHCPEPIPPVENHGETMLFIDNHDLKTSSSIAKTKSLQFNENKPQQIRFPLNEEEKIQMLKYRSTLRSVSDSVLPPYPIEYMSSSNADDAVRTHFFTQPSSTTMVADFIPNSMTINVFEVFIYAWGVIAFFFDMITDLVLAHAYFLEGAYWLFLLTLMCVVLPNLTLSIFSLVWYIDGSQLKAAAKKRQSSSNDTFEQIEEINTYDEKSIPIDQNQDSHCQTSDRHVDGDNTSNLRPKLELVEAHEQPKQCFQISAATANVVTWIIRILILILQLDLCLKYIRGLYYTWKGFQQRKDPKWQRFYLTKQILIDADIALLRVFDCFMDAGSQVTLQLYIMLRLSSVSMKFDTLFLKQTLSIVSSLGSLAYALSGYSRCWRHMQLTHSPQDWPKEKPPPQMVSWWSTIMQWFWYLFLITPRVLALAMFAATFRSWFWIIIFAHWFGMLFWILRFRTIFCIGDQTKYNPREAIFEKCYNLVCSYIFIFCYMNLRKGDTRTHYVGFYTIYYIENIAFSVIYAVHSTEPNLTFKYSLVGFVCCGFWFAILFQFLYYRFLHPSDHVRLNMKRDVSSILRCQACCPRSSDEKSKSCETMINHNALENSNDTSTCTKTKLKLENSIDERRYNRFAKRNRQKLISQQQAIDKTVRLTRAQQHLKDTMERNHESSNKLLGRITNIWKRPTTMSTVKLTEPSTSAILVEGDINEHQQLINVRNVLLPTSGHQSQLKLCSIVEDTNLNNGNDILLNKEHTMDTNRKVLSSFPTKLQCNPLPDTASSVTNSDLL